MKVLIVSPDQLLPRVARRPLEAAGHDVEHAPTGEQMDAALAGGGHDLVLLPARLGAQQGADLARRARQAGASTILVSADAEPSPAERGDSFDGRLPVPFSSAELLQLVGAATRERRLILVADDSELVHRHTAPALEQAGYDVVSAMDGNQALERAFERLPDLVVTDVEMPGADGFIVCQTLKQDPRTRHVPVIIATTHGEAESLEQGFDAGADDYLVKPVVLEDLLGRIRVLIAGVELSGRERVVVVDDSPAVRHLVADTLGRQGFEVTVAEDGARGLEVARRMAEAEEPGERPALVITDYDMPVMTGFELVHALKRHPATRDIPTMMLTARDSRRDQAQMRAAGLTSYLVKPFSMDKCIAMVERILAERRLMAYKEASQLYLSEGAVAAAEAQARSGRIGAVRADELELSVLFSDICGFTSMSASLTPPEVVGVLNEYFDAMCPLIKQHGGDIDKFIGDAIMALFPERVGEDPPPLRAVRAALQMQRANAELFAGRQPRLQMRIGINTGPVVRGDIGSRHASGGRDYTVIGDTVNRAQRFESSAPRGGVLVSESTYLAVAGQVRAEPAPGLQLKGVPEPVNAYVIHELEPAGEERERGS